MEWTIETISLAVAAFSAFASAIAAIFGVASYCVAKRNDRGYIRRQIENKKAYIQEQNNLKFENRRNPMNGICEEDRNIAKAQREIAKLEARL